MCNCIEFVSEHLNAAFQVFWRGSPTAAEGWANLPACLQPCHFSFEHVPVVLDVFLDWHDNEDGESGSQHIIIKSLWLIRLFVFPELQILPLLSYVDNPLFLCRRVEVVLKCVDLVDKFVRNLFLVKSDEELWKGFNLLVKQLNDVLSNVVREEPNLETFPEV